MIKVEEIGGTAAEPTGGFSHLEFLVAPISAFETIAEPKDIENADAAKVAASLSELATITADHTFKTGEGFTKLKGIQDKNGLESSMIGEKKGRVFENKLTVVIPGTDTDTIGYLRLIKNEDLIVLAREAGSGKYRQIGHAKYPASLSEGNPKIAPEYEGENATTMVFMDKNLVAAPVYTGAITLMPTV